VNLRRATATVVEWACGPCEKLRIVSARKRALEGEFAVARGVELVVSSLLRFRFSRRRFWRH
jgi:hypothetical protein